MLDVFEKTRNNSVLRDVPDECSTGAKRLLAPLYMLSYLLTAQQACCLYAGSKTLALKWKPHGIQLCIPLFTAGMDTYKTWSAFANLLGT